LFLHDEKSSANKLKAGKHTQNSPAKNQKLINQKKNESKNRRVNVSFHQ